MIVKLRKIPLWAWTLLLAVVYGCSSVFLSKIESSYFGLLFPSTIKTLFITLTCLAAVVVALVMRIVLRAGYWVSGKMFFSLTKHVPDYNLRKLPILYGDYIRCFMLALIVQRAINALLQLILYTAQQALYIVNAFAGLLGVGALWLAYCIMDKNVPTWQKGKCCAAVMIPTTIVVLLTSMLSLL